MGTSRLECWTCGKEHYKRDCPHNQGGRPQIYSAQEAQIPRIYVAVDNKHAGHQASFIEIYSKLYDQVISIFIYPISNYSYVSPNLVDKCGLSKELHAESWLVQLAIGTKK